MTASQIIDNTIPQLQLQDTIAKALQLMGDYGISHLPVVEGEKYLGLISEGDLLDRDDEKGTLQNCLRDLLPAAVNERDYFLKAVPVSQLYHTHVIPVINEAKELTGSIGSAALIKAMGELCGAEAFGAIVVLEVQPVRLSISEINSIVESDGATMHHLNITPLAGTGLLQVTIQINKKEISTIIATFERYDYSVSFYTGDELFDNEISSNYQNLMHYLDV